MGALVVMKSGLIAYAEGALESSVGRPADTLLGRPLTSLLDGEHSATTSELALAMAQPQARTLLIRLKAVGEGSTARPATAFVPPEDELSRHHGCRAVYIKPSAAPLDAGASDNGVSESASAGDERIDHFLRRLTHELKTPLNAIIGFSELLMMDPSARLQRAHRDSLQRILESAWYLNDLMEGMRDLACLRRDSAKFLLGPVDIQDVVRPAVEMLRQEALKRQIVLGLVMSPDVRAAVANRTRLEQVVVNLLANAVKYNRDGGTVTLETKRTHTGAVAIEVCNTGDGLSDAQLAGLFEPFNRLGKESTGIPGSGIGLALCHRLVELMGGTLSASSAIGVWTTFRLVLPAAELGVA
jgi:signal transduction histidine kinase